MAQISFGSKGSKSLETIECEEDLVLGPGMHLNPPPKDGRCECCGRHLSELKPFGKVNVGLIGNVEGALLVKNFRPNRSYDAGIEQIMKEENGKWQKYYDLVLERCLWRVTHHVEEEGAYSYRVAKMCGSLLASWECQDCLVLDDDEYFERLDQRQNEQAQALSESL